jgi:hypothetical protein
VANPAGQIRPCARCPFRADIEPYLRYMRAVEIAYNLYAGSEFPCHETTEHDEDTGEYVPNARKERFCAGAAITMLRYDGPNQMMRILDRIYPGWLEALEKEDAKGTIMLYEDIEEWIAAHDEAERKERRATNTRQ